MADGVLAQGVGGLLKGFADEFARQQQAKLAAEQAQDQLFLKAVIDNPNLAALPGAQKSLKRFGLSQEDIAAFSQFAEAQRLAAEQQQATLMQGVERGQLQQGFTVGSGGQVTQQFTPVPAAEQTRRGQADARKRITELQRANITVFGHDSQQARIDAVHQAQAEGLDIPKADQRLLDFAPSRDIGGGGAPAGAVPAGGQPAAAQAPAPAGLGLAGRQRFETETAQRAAELATPKRLSDKQQSSLTQISQVMSGAERLIDTAARIENQLGPVTGRVAKVQDALGTGSPELREFRRLRNRLIDDLARARTGAQASGLEFGRLDKLLPDVQDTPENFVAGLRAFVAGLHDSVEANRNALSSQNILVPETFRLSPRLQQIVASATPQARQPMQQAPGATAPASGAAPGAAPVDLGGGFTFEVVP
jgi:hypothetical protein